MIFNRLALALTLTFAYADSISASSSIRFVSTIPELAWSAKEIGGDLVEASALLKGSENPHYVDAVPEFILRVANADIVCIAGLDLESGFMPPILTRSGNAKVQPGGPGYCEAARTVNVLERPTGAVDRSMGDIHPTGNPHFYLSPRALAEASQEITRALTIAMPTHANAIAKGQVTFAKKLKAISDEARAFLAPALAAKSTPLLMEYHREFTYYFSEFGLTSFGSIEEKPGVAPSAGRIAEIALAAKAAGVKLVISTDYAPAGVLKRFHELSGIPVVTVPTMIKAAGPYSTYADLQRHIATSIATHMAAK